MVEELLNDGTIELGWLLDAQGSDDFFSSGMAAGVWLNSSNNISSDGTAPGASSLTGVSAAATFMNVTDGAEDLHIQVAGPACGAGAAPNRAAYHDIDGDWRWSAPYDVSHDFSR